ncbi:YbaB/EbfC family nucleoid-associated protein [Candidatus Parcubacteria bacterium]|nr:YbaB/EbfC family nucleoid-associated protein [Candidatus Parcubacteria bacterium]
MFNKLKQVKDLRSQAKTMQNALADEIITVEKNGISLEMNGNMEIKKISINSDLSKEKMENILKDLFNGAIKKTQRVMAKKMQEMGGFPGLG